MKSYVKFAILAGLVVGLAGLPAFASVSQYQQSGQQPSGPPAASGQTAKAQPPPKLNPKEEKAYKDFYSTPSSNPQAVISSGESFMKKFPDSPYASSVYARLAAAYEATGDSQKMFDAGHKALQLDPNNVDVLSLMAYAIPRRIDPNNLSSGQQLQEATDDANKALDLLSKMQKPANLTQDQFTAAINAESASCHSGLGLVDYYQHNITGMVSEFEQAVKLEPTPDPTDEFLLGIGYMQAGRPTDAVTVLEKCSEGSGQIADRCKSSLSEAKKLAASPAKQ